MDFNEINISDLIIVRVEKTWSSGSVRTHLAFTDEHFFFTKGEDLNSDINAEVEDWAMKDPSGQSRGYTITWEIVEDEEEKVKIAGELLSDLLNKLDVLNSELQVLNYFRSFMIKSLSYGS